ncbi:MAG: hypothetical protein HYV14_00550 [Elusimicrobia bacterium]|nr:hypothetical protein [Elusimicrobiota bacterium]
MRTVNAILLFVLAAAPLRAQTPAVSAADACKKLEAQARKLTSEKVRCEVLLHGLVLTEVTPAGRKAIEEGLLAERKYLGYAVVEAPVRTAGTPVLPSPVVLQAQADELTAAQARIRAQAVVADFDNAAARLGSADRAGSSDRSSDALRDAVADVPLVKADMAAGKNAKFVLVQQGPPGSAGGPPGSGGREQQQDTTRRGGPPGSGGDQQNPPRSGPPGSGNQNPPRSGPPGSGSQPGGQNPGGGTTPPSRPAPVWRSSFPPPAPNWWNTDFDHYDWWNSLPSGYDRPHKDQSNPDTFYYYSGWYRWRDVFVTNWGRTEDTATISRTAANQDKIHSRSLTSQSYREAKECYYQAVYRYDWSQGGFYGSHWEERFDHYKARCIRLPREYGQPRVYTTHVSFDMSLVQGQDLPWENDVIRITYDGTGQPRYDFSGAAYRYSSRLDDQRGGSESVTLVAGAKVLRAPEADKVSAFLRNNGGRIELVINDDRASFYQGETLRINARVVRRDVIKVKGLLWGWNEKNVDSVIHSSPIDVLTGNSPQNITDLTSAASAPKPANFVRSSIFIASWEFSRVNSRISTGAVIRKGQGNSIAN